MNILWNMVLGLGAAVSAAVLLLQGFVLPSIGAALDLILRYIASICVQWLFLRNVQKKAVQAIPIFISAIAAVWGFFLYLTSPSWYGATFHDFVTDYASFFIGCALVWAFAWFLPRIIPRVKKAIKAKKRKNRKFVK